MSKSSEAGPIRLTLNIEDRALSDRLAALLANVPGLRLVGGTKSADVVLVLSTEVSASADRDMVLTPRELEVLTLLAEGMSNKAIARRPAHTNRRYRCAALAACSKLSAPGSTASNTPVARSL